MARRPRWCDDAPRRRAPARLPTARRRRRARVIAREPRRVVGAGLVLGATLERVNEHARGVGEVLHRRQAAHRHREGCRAFAPTLGLSALARPRPPLHRRMASRGSRLQLNERRAASRPSITSRVALGCAHTAFVAAPSGGCSPTPRSGSVLLARVPPIPRPTSRVRHVRVHSEPKHKAQAKNLIYFYFPSYDSIRWVGVAHFPTETVGLFKFQKYLFLLNCKSMVPFKTETFRGYPPRASQRIIEKII